MTLNRRGTRAAALAVLALAGCGPSAEASVAANAVHDGADACLRAVRDGHAAYGKTPACTTLRAFASAYVEASADGRGSPKTELLYERAQRKAWTAVAMSEACEGAPIRIW